MNETCTCGCCAGVEAVTPMPTANRPGLPALATRVGTHATFFETMLARLSQLELEFPRAETDKDGKLIVDKSRPLQALTTRDPGDPAIALLDSWALVGDVLSFYQERIANEGYLRTATERRSILELARLIGYAPRPGVASSVYLAYTLDEDRSAQPPKPTATTIPKGGRVQSIPGPGELPQPFETSEVLAARSQWNKLQARLTRPQTMESILANGIFLNGTATNLKPNDPLLIEFGDCSFLKQYKFAIRLPMSFRVRTVEDDAEADRTHVRLRPWRSSKQVVATLGEIASTFAEDKDFQPSIVGAEVKAMIVLLKELRDQVAKDQKVPNVMNFLLNDNGLGNMRKIREQPGLKEEVVRWITDVLTELETAAYALFIANELERKPGAHPPPAERWWERLKAVPKTLPTGAQDLKRNVADTFASKADGVHRLLIAAAQPQVGAFYFDTLKNLPVTQPSEIKLFALRVSTGVFGNVAPPKNRETGDDHLIEQVEWDADDMREFEGVTEKEFERISILYLETSFGKILPDSWILVDSTAVSNVSKKGRQFIKTSGQPVLARTRNVQSEISRKAYGLSAKTTRVELINPIDASLNKAWMFWRRKESDGGDFQMMRHTSVFAQSEEIALAEEPITEPICDGRTNSIELETLQSGLLSGRWLIFAGERADIIDDDGVAVPGVMGAELAMLASACKVFDSDLPGDKNHTAITLVTSLAYCYKRETLTIYGNVVKATHGETRIEPANGDATKAFQEFALKQSPLTHVSTVKPSGIESTLQLRVNDVLWHETDSLAEIGPTERRFISRTDDEGKTSVICGDGKHGARLPSGSENVKLIYRNGIGKPGNVKAGQISLLVHRPLNVRDVVNPLPATGGADRESRDQARENAPLAVMALDRLVSTVDYADFARTFAGVGKAVAARLADGQRQLVQMTVAGAEDIPISPASDLFHNLRAALREFGDPSLPVQLAPRELLLLVVQANVRVLPDYLWEKVEPKVRAALLDYFGFQRRELGQDARLSEVFSAIQAVEGVAFVDVDHFDSLSEEQVVDALAHNKSLAEIIAAGPKNRVCVEPAHVERGETDPDKRILPAQLAYFTPAVPDTIILNPVKP